jgi:hypothetical protein
MNDYVKRAKDSVMEAGKEEIHITARVRPDRPLMSTSPGGGEIRMMPDPWANMLAHLPPGSTLTLTIQTPEAKS